MKILGFKQLWGEHRRKKNAVALTIQGKHSATCTETNRVRGSDRITARCRVLPTNVYWPTAKVHITVYEYKLAGSGTCVIQA